MSFFGGWGLWHRIGIVALRNRAEWFGLALFSSSKRRRNGFLIAGLILLALSTASPASAGCFTGGSSETCTGDLSSGVSAIVSADHQPQRRLAHERHRTGRGHGRDQFHRYRKSADGNRQRRRLLLQYRRRLHDHDKLRSFIRELSITKLRADGPRVKRQRRLFEDDRNGRTKGTIRPGSHPQLRLSGNCECIRHRHYQCIGRVYTIARKQGRKGR